MSGQTKVKSLSLSRKTQAPQAKEASAKPIIAEDERTNISNLEAVLSSPIARPSRFCSTPIQKNVDFVEDSPDQDYRGSPMSLYPCTQESNEIAWDWQGAGGNKTNDVSPGVEKTNTNSLATLNNTPKRPQKLFRKKRSAKSYSPLLNMPTKRKLANQEVAESIGKFAAELKALADKIITEQNTQINGTKNGDGEIVGKVFADGSKEAGICDMKTQNCFDIHEATTLEVSCINEEKTDPEKLDSSLDDLFDDGVDACMVQCSQEIEDKLRLDSGTKETKSVVNLSNENEAGGRKNRRGASTSSSNRNTGAKSCTVNIETRYDVKHQRETSSNSKSKEKTDSMIVPNGMGLLLESNIEASQIPDDSFDDCLALCLDDDDDLISKFLRDKKPADTGKKFNSGSAAGSKFKPEEKSSNNSALDDSSNFKRKQQFMGPESAAATPQSRKYLKAKSLSDSYCENSNLGKNEKMNSNPSSNLGRSYNPPISKSTSNCNLNTNLRPNETRNKVPSTPNLSNCIPAAGGRNNSCHNFGANQPSGTTVSYSYLRSSSDNLAANASNKVNHDPYLKPARLTEKPLKDLRTTVPPSTQQLRYNEEEIERKRLEAKMRLANKLKRQNSDRSNVGISLQNKRPGVKM